MDILPIHYFALPCIVHLKNSSMSYIEHPNIGVHYVMSKSHIQEHHHQSHKKSLELLKSSQTHSGGYILQNSNFHLNP